jgi:NADP-dependent 3-hydroxy acid dehydrogenase YdfG
VSKLNDHVVVITGASSGIGRATALAFADEGAVVAVIARRADALEDLAAECRERGSDAIALPADVADAEAMEHVAQHVTGHYGRLDVWVNNAGVSLFARVEEAPVNTWYRVIETNVFGTYNGVRAALPRMREQGSGVIINVSSVVGKVGSPFMSSYVASKHAVRALSDCVRQEVLDAPGIQVCTVLPGPADTPLHSVAGNYSGHAIKPLAPVISAERVAHAIVSCAKQPRREVVVGASTASVLGLDRIAPGLVERIAARQVEHEHFTSSPEQSSPGNILEPADDAATISGGWSRSARFVGPQDSHAASTDGTRTVRRIAAGTTPSPGRPPSGVSPSAPPEGDSPVRSDTAAEPIHPPPHGVPSTRPAAVTIRASRGWE